MDIKVIGIDLAKSVFQVCALNGKELLHEFRTNQEQVLLVALPPHL